MTRRPAATSVWLFATLLAASASIVCVGGCATGRWPYLLQRDGTACDGGDVAACRRVSQSASFHQLEDKDQARAKLQADEKGCALGDAEACYLFGNGTTDLERRRVAYVRGCDLGNDMACRSADVTGERHLYPGGPKVIVIRDPSCRNGDPDCVRLLEEKLRRGEAGALALLRKKECGDRPDDPTVECDARLGEYLAITMKPPTLDRARPLFATACEKNQKGACRNLAVLLLDPTAGPIDAERAAGIFESSCKPGGPDRWACIGLAKAKADDDPPRARAAIESACGDDAKCRLEAARILAGAGHVAFALPDFESACSRRESPALDACVDAGQALLASKRAKDAVQRFTRACDSNVATGCTHLAALYAAGLAVRKDGRRAKELAARACKLGDPNACTDLEKLSTFGAAMREVYGEGSRATKGAAQEALRAMVTWPIWAVARLAVPR